jgi:hypothetical protein
MLLALLKNVKNWVFDSLQGLADVEDRFVASMFKDKDKDESNKG